MEHRVRNISDDQCIAMFRDFFQMQDKLRVQKEATDKRRGYELDDYKAYALPKATVSYFRELFMS